MTAIFTDNVIQRSFFYGLCRFERVQQNYTNDFKTLTDCQHIIIDFDTKGDYGERIVDLTDDALYILQLLHDYYEALLF